MSDVTSTQHRMDYSRLLANARLLYFLGRRLRHVSEREPQWRDVSDDVGLRGRDAVDHESSRHQ